MSIIEKNIVKILLDYGCYPNWIGMAGNRDQTRSGFRLVVFVSGIVAMGRVLVLLRWQCQHSGAGQTLVGCVLLKVVSFCSWEVLFDGRSFFVPLD